MHNNLIQSHKVYKAGIYIRLSEADEGKSYESDSESIINQRNMLMDYVRENHFVFISEYVDDGYSGTDFERPGFKKMIEDIENKVINLVIVKDLSRLGRDHIKTGYYIETFFPENDVRFISMQEGYDNSLNQASNDSSTFIIACNDYYSRQNSVKIRNVLNGKRKQGKFIGSMPSYGYMRDPDDKGHLIPNPEYAPVVKKIFEMAYNGVGISDITSYLNSNKVKTPSSLKRKNPNAKSKYNPIWTISSVKKILRNQMYIGDMVQCVQTKINYKSKKKRTLPREYWEIVKNTHEPLVNRIIFEKVQDHVKRTNKTNITKREKRLFENLIYCRECGNTLTISYRKNCNYWTVNCNKYSRDPRRKLCEPHFIPYEKLEGALLSTIKSTCKNYIEQVNVTKLAKEISNKKKINCNQQDTIKELQNKEKEYLNKLDVLYEDKFKGIVSEETYKRLANETERLLNNIREQQQNIKSAEKIVKNKKIDLKEIENNIKSLIDIENPTRELLQTIINKIIIDKDKNIEIIYKFSTLNRI